MVTNIRNFQKVIWIGTENTVSFDLKEELIGNFEKTFRTLNEVVVQNGSHAIERVFDLGYYRINAKQYLKCPHIAYRIDSKNILEIWIERLNRVVVYLKVEDKLKGEQKTVKRFQIEGPEDIPKLTVDVGLHLKKVTEI